MRRREREFLSRIVTLPGERIVVRRDVVRIDGEVLDEPSVKACESTAATRGRAALTACVGRSAL